MKAVDIRKLFRTQEEYVGKELRRKGGLEPIEVPKISVLSN